MRTREKLAFGDAVNLTWLDSKVLDGWNYSPEERRRPGVVQSLGRVVQDGDDCLTITSSIHNKLATIDDLVIPRGAIVSIEKLPEYSLLGPEPPID